MIMCVEMETALTGHTWSREYEEIVTYYYWEPQHLRPKAGWTAGEPGVAQMWRHNQRLEVATNHVFDLYLSMVSFSSLNDDREWVHGKGYEMVPSTWLRYQQAATGTFTQPDLYLRGVDRGLAIELKTGTKSSVSQIFKYVCFHALSAPALPLSLLFITPHQTWGRVLKEDVPLADVRRVLHEQELPPAATAVRERVKELVDDLQIRTITYTEVRDRVVQLRDAATDSIAKRVHAGFASWLESARVLRVET